MNNLRTNAEHKFALCSAFARFLKNCKLYICELCIKIIAAKTSNFERRKNEKQF